MQANSSLKKLNAKATISPNVGPIQFLQKSIGALFLSYFQVIIETAAPFPEKLKCRSVIIIMRPLASLTGCYVARRQYGQ